MEALKIIGKIFVWIIEYICLVALCIPHLIILLLWYLVQFANDAERYEDDLYTVRDGTPKERRDVERTRSEMNWKRNTTFADHLYNYWKEHFNLFSKKSSTKKSHK